MGEERNTPDVSERDALIEEIARRAGVRAERGRRFAELTSLRVGGAIDWLLAPETEEQAASVVGALEEAGVAWRVLGAGSNVLADDAEHHYVVVNMREVKGEVRFDGERVEPRDRDRMFRMRRRMGMLFQFGALFTDLSVFDNVAFPLREHTDLPESMIRDIVLMKLNAVGLRGAAGLRISEVSGGMARRIALARAIALDPQLIMYDEPFAGLDLISMGVAANLIRTLNDVTGATSLVVSHDVPECMAISDYVVLMAPGRIVAQGLPSELMSSTDPEVRQFVRGEPDGPVKFHYPARPLAEDFDVRPEKVA
jgi:phospholipid/cholesterol/gamma-HCH transport system ATP-binding protein